MNSDLDMGTLYVGVNDTSLVVKYFSTLELKWRKNSRSFRVAGKNCAEKTVRDISQLVLNANANISFFAALEEQKSQEYFIDSVKRSYEFYADREKVGNVTARTLLD